MAEKSKVYKCEVCGNIVEVLHAGGGTLACCDQPMKLMAENSTDAATEKHVPVVERAEGGFKVKVGSVSHPMEEAHYIEWIDVNNGGKTFRKYLNPGDAPEAVFNVEGGAVTARAYCNLHGYWKGEG